MYYLSFAAAMIVPVCLFLAGIMWKTKPPAYLSQGLCYRTTLTEKSQEAWQFAHFHCAKLWTRAGLILIVLTAVLMYFLKESYISYLLWIIFFQMVIFCISAFFVEILLKSCFDENGNKIV